MFTLHNGDCLQVMPSIPSGSIDAIITDLPYGTTACKWDTVIEFAPMWKEVKRVLKPNGVFITTASQPFTTILINSNFSNFRYEWIWHKNHPAGFGNANKMPLKTHENIVVFYEKLPTYNKILEPRDASKKSINRYKYKMSLGTGKGVNQVTVENRQRPIPVSIEYRNPTTVQKFDVVKRTQSIHGTQKPVALYEYLIRTYTNEGETVLDIAMGSGTTIEAAERTGRNSIGIEKDECIFQSAVLRLKPFTPSNTASTRQGRAAPEFDNFE